MKDHNYITIQGWMVNRLKLSGNELLAYATVWGFSQDGRSSFRGSGQYLTDALGVSRRSIVTILSKLVDKGHLKKCGHARKDAGFIGYKAVRGCEDSSQGCEETSQGGVKKLHRTSEETSHNITRDTLEHKEFNAPENPPDFPDPRDPSTAVAVAFEEPRETDLFAFGEISEPQTASETAQIEREGTAIAPIAAKTNPTTIQGDSARWRGESALVPARSRSPPAKSKKTDLSPEQLVLFHAGKAGFESDEKAKALIYQDPASTAREMKHLKTLAVRCANIAPEMPAVFLQNILEHFRIMCPKHGWVFTPHTLVTTWIWNKVIDSLPGPENERLRELVRGMFD